MTSRAAQAAIDFIVRQKQSASAMSPYLQYSDNGYWLPFVQNCPDYLPYPQPRYDIHCFELERKQSWSFLTRNKCSYLTISIRTLNSHLYSLNQNGARLLFPSSLVLTSLIYNGRRTMIFASRVEKPTTVFVLNLRQIGCCCSKHMGWRFPRCTRSAILNSMTKSICLISWHAIRKSKYLHLTNMHFQSWWDSKN